MGDAIVCPSVQPGTSHVRNRSANRVAVTIRSFCSVPSNHWLLVDHVGTNRCLKSLLVHVTLPGSSTYADCATSVMWQAR